MRLFRARLLGLLLSFTVMAGCNPEPIVVNSPINGTRVVRDISNIRITGFVEDPYGFIWMSTNMNGVLRYDGERYVHYYSDDQIPNTLASNMVKSMIVDSRGNLWVGTQNGLNRFDYEDNSFSHLYYNGSNSYILSVLEDKIGNVYYLTYRAMFRYNEETNSFERVINFPQVSSTLFSDGLFDKSNQFWIVEDNVVKHYDTSFQLLEEIQLPGIPSYCSHDGINTFEMVVDGRYFTLSTDTSYLKEKAESQPIDAGNREIRFTDSHNNIWTASESGGFEVRSVNNQAYGDDVLFKYFKDHSIGSTASNGDYYWAVIDGGTIMTYNIREKRIVKCQSLPEDLQCSIRFPEIVYSLDNRILLKRLGKEFFVMNVNSDGTLSKERKYFSDYNMVVTMGVYGDIWGAGPRGNIYHSNAPSPEDKLTKLDNVVATLQHPYSFPDRIETLSNGDVLVLQTDNHPYIIDHQTNKLIDLCADNGDWQIYYSCVFQDSNNTVWIGSSDKGLFRYEPINRVLTRVDEFGNSAILQIQEEEKGHIVFFVDRYSVYDYYYSQDKFSKIWSSKEDFPSGKSLLLFPNNKVAIKDGDKIYTLFNSNIENALSYDEMNVTVASGKQALVSFRVQQKKKAVCKIKMDEKKVDLSLLVSVLDVAGNNIFDYKCCFSRKERNSMREVNDADIIIPNLKYGINRVWISVNNRYDTDQNNTFLVKIMVKYPWYMVALSFLSVNVLIILCVLGSIARRRRKEAEYEKKKRMLQEDNINFFANISHEFRAPLTLINGAVSSIAEKESLAKDTTRYVKIIQRSTNRLLKLTSQILDFNKLDNGMMPLYVKMEDIADVINQVVNNFSIGAAQKNIDLKVSGCDEPLLGWIDVDKVEKILYNICSNALKFTPPSGSVAIGVETMNNRVYVTIRDSGIGIPEELIDKLFDRFAQSSASAKAGGTGIGLYYAKSLVQVHKGNIEASNVVEDGNVTGALFSFDLPIDRESYKENEIAIDKSEGNQMNRTVNEQNYVAESQIYEENQSRATVLLIDDDYEFIYYLKDLLSKYYNVLFRFDAMSGYDVIEKQKPDLIITDVMMTDVDGLQLCKIIKDNLEICHIPVVVLTAKSTLDSQIDSLNIGADAFCGKPFSQDYLLALIRSLIENRNRVSKIFNTSLETPKNKENIIGIRDREFMDKVYALMEKNIIVGEMDISSFADELGVSRSKFFYKIKALTGQTPNDFFNTFKLNYAAKMINEGKIKISAIASMVGFNSASYFSMIFKKQFGVLPSDYYKEYAENQQYTK